MKEFQDRRKVRQRLYSPLSIIAVAIVAILIFRGASDVYDKARISRTQAARAEKQYKELQIRHDRLKADLSSLSTNEGKEAEIRKKFDVSKEGEEVIIVVDKIEPATTTEEEGIIRRAWQTIKGVFGR